MWPWRWFPINSLNFQTYLRTKKTGCIREFWCSITMPGLRQRRITIACCLGSNFFLNVLWENCPLNILVITTYWNVYLQQHPNRNLLTILNENCALRRSISSCSSEDMRHKNFWQCKQIKRKEQKPLYILLPKKSTHDSNVMKLLY